MPRRTKAAPKSAVMVEAGRKAAHTRKWRAAVAKAQRTLQWAITMTWVLIKRSAERRAWRVVDCHSGAGFESAGIVDLVVVRRDFSPTSRGDLLEVVLVQVKGGTGAWPTREEIARLRRTAKHHRACAVVLSTWDKGKMPTLYTPRSGAASTRRKAWTEIDEVAAFFAAPRAYLTSCTRASRTSAARQGRAEWSSVPHRDQSPIGRDANSTRSPPNHRRKGSRSSGLRSARFLSSSLSGQRVSMNEGSPSPARTALLFRAVRQ
jgi:hypothetical protein